MDPMLEANLAAIMTGFTAGSVQGAATQRDHHVGLLARQGDNTALDHRLLTGALMSELFTGTAPAKLATLNTASHTPIPQPYKV